MKKSVLQVLVLAVVSILPLAAQGPRPFHRGGDRGDSVQDSADAIARRVTFLTTLLTLSTTQATQATEMFTNAATTVAPLRTSLSTARTSLTEAVGANNGSLIDQLSTQIGTLTGQITAAENRAEAAFYALLTAEQRTRYETVRGPGGRR